MRIQKEGHGLDMGCRVRRGFLCHTEDIPVSSH
jgi:hypothetical protein